MAPPFERREFLLGTLAMAIPHPTPKYRIIDPHVHVWVNDPHYPWAKGDYGATQEGRHALDASRTDEGQPS